MKYPVLLALAFFAVGAQGADFLPAEQAFDLQVERTASGLALVANVAPGYALYREKIRVSGTDLAVSKLDIPRGRPVDEPGLGRTELLTGKVRVQVQATGYKPGASRLTVDYQGCKIDEYCYPPQRASFTLGVDR